MVKTIAKKTISLCFYEIDKMKGEENAECGETTFEIPGVEMFLGSDQTCSNVYFLTNSRLIGGGANA